MIFNFMIPAYTDDSPNYGKNLLDAYVQITWELCCSQVQDITH